MSCEWSDIFGLEHLLANERQSLAVLCAVWPLGMLGSMAAPSAGTCREHAATLQHQPGGRAT